MVLLATGVSSLRRVGAVDTPRGSFGAGMRLLLPVGALVLGPSIGFALAAGDPLLADGMTLPLAAALLLLAVAIAVNEELWFRGLVLDQLDRAHRPWLTVLGGAVLFGLPHVAATSASWLNAAAVTLAVAIPFTVVRLRVGSIWPLVAWHAAIDAWAFLHTASVVPEGTPSAGEAAVALVLPAIVAAGYLRWWSRSRGELTP
jgi:membrane protease YdiL (CAAX protease family)